MVEIRPPFHRVELVRLPRPPSRASVKLPALDLQVTHELVVPLLLLLFSSPSGSTSSPPPPSPFALSPRRSPCVAPFTARRRAHTTAGSTSTKGLSFLTTSSSKFFVTTTCCTGFHAWIERSLTRLVCTPMSTILVANRPGGRLH